VDSITADMKEGKITVVGEADPVRLATKIRKLGYRYRAELVSVEEKKGAEKKTEEKKPADEKKTEEKTPAKKLPDGKKTEAKKPADENKTKEKTPADEKEGAEPSVPTVACHVNPQKEYWPYEGYPDSHTDVRDDEGYPKEYTIVRDEHPTACTIM